MRVAFFDETGRASSTEFVGMAACVGLWSHWQEFNSRWTRALVDHGAPYLHMVEFAHFRGPFTGWTEPQRQGLMRACLDSLSDLELYFFSAVMKASDFENLPEEDKKGLEDPYLCLFQECLHGVALTGHLDLIGERVDVVYSQQDEFRRRFQQMYQQWSRFSVDGRRLGRLSFGDMRRTPGLQLADLVAYESLHHYHLRAHQPHRPPRIPFVAIISHQHRLGAGGFRYIPQWVLGPKSNGTWPAVQEALWSDVEANMDIILQLGPSPAFGPAQVRRLVRLRDMGALERLRAGHLRGR